MILQELTALYDRLVEKGELEKSGWQPVKVHYALRIDTNGELKQIVSLLQPVSKGKKTAFVPSILNVPAQAKRSSGVCANFLCDNSGYMLGVDGKGKPERARSCFSACRELHEKLLAGVDHPAAKAILRFFETWKPEAAESHAVFKEFRDEIISGGNLVFMIGMDYAQDIPEMKQAWDTSGADEDGELMRCLVTGKLAPVAKLHPSIKGVKDAQSSGASLVSFNAPAYESFGRDNGQGANAPVSQAAAFAYGAALNYLLSRNENRMQIGDATVVFWAEDAEPAYAACFAELMEGGETIGADTLLGIMKNLATGKTVDWKEIPLHPENHFFILGLSPNAARLSVRFFLQDSFGGFAEKLQRHYDRINISRPSYDTRETLSAWSLLNETVNQKSRDKTPSPQLAGSFMRAILTDGSYPATLMNQVQMRIRAEHEVTRGRAAIIKAYLIKNGKNTEDFKNYKEVLSVALNSESQYPAYLLGRLFALLEGLQQTANPGINATIRDRYFNSACATPGVVFPQLIRLAQAHLRKLNTGSRIFHERQIAEIMSAFDQPYPQRLNLYDQGVFQLGYYHQTQKRYEKKEDKENV